MVRSLKNNFFSVHTKLGSLRYYLLKKKSTIQSNAKKKALFENSGKKATVRKKRKEKIIEANREIIGTLLALSAKHDNLINFETALQCSLCPVPLSLAYPDGPRRKTTKSALMSTGEDKSPPKQNAAFLVDLMALI